MFRPGRSGDHLAIREELRSLVVFRHLNLIEPWPISGRFEVIFCRNVAIYMDPPTRTRLWQSLTRVLAGDGVLFLGHSERPAVPDDRLESFAPSAFRHRRGRSDHISKGR